MYFYVLTILTFLQALIARAVFQYRDCTPPDSPLNLTKIDITPNPIVLPGNIRLTLEASSGAPVGSSSLQLSLTRKSFLGDIHIPCLLNVGSCKYDDICTLLDQMEKENWAGVMGNIGTQFKTMLTEQGLNPSQCPFPATSLRIENYDIRLPEVPSVLSSFAAGDYHLHISVVEKSTGVEFLCIDAEMHLKQQCSGLACIFG